MSKRRDRHFSQTAWLSPRCLLFNSFIEARQGKTSSRLVMLPFCEEKKAGMLRIIFSAEILLHGLLAQRITLGKGVYCQTLYHTAQK